MEIETYFDPFPVLETPRTRLRKIRADDQLDIFNYCRNPEVSKYTVWDAHRSLSDTKQFMDMVESRYETHSVGPWGIEDKRTNKIIGSCSFVNWDNRNHKAELGYVLSYDYWHQGYMSEVVHRIIQFGFHIGLVRVEARCHPMNVGSARVMEKCGMQYEGFLRKHILAKGEFQDVKLYAIVRD